MDAELTELKKSLDELQLKKLPTDSDDPSAQPFKQLAEKTVKQWNKGTANLHAELWAMAPDALEDANCLYRAVQHRNLAQKYPYPVGIGCF